MANKRITDVDFLDSLSSNESFFVNQNNSIKQINKSNIVFDIANGGTGATNGADGLANLFAEGDTILSSHQYGNELPVAGKVGRIYFKKVSI